MITYQHECTIIETLLKLYCIIITFLIVSLLLLGIMIFMIVIFVIFVCFTNYSRGTLRSCDQFHNRFHFHDHLMNQMMNH